jgi:hypothetical protein
VGYRRHPIVSHDEVVNQDTRPVKQKDNNINEE